MTFEELMAQWLASGPAPGTPQAVPSAPAPVASPVAATAQPKLMPGGGGVTGLDTSLPSAVTSQAAPKAAGMGQGAAGAGSLAALALQIGAAAANKPAVVKSGADEFLAESATQRRQGIAEMMAANPNVNQALAQRNAAQAHAQQSQAIAQRAASMRVAADNANAAAAQQAKQERIQAILSGVATGVTTGLTFASDERIKTNVQPAGTQVDQMLAGIKPVQFDVPRAGEQARTGIMAQDLMQSPMGARMVQPAADGTLKVDGSAALEGSLAANARLNERLTALEQALSARAGASINEMVQRDLASRSATPSPTPAPSPVGAAPGVPPTAPVAPPPVVPPTPPSGAPVSSDPEGQAILDRVYQATQPMMSPKQGDPFEDLLQASQQGPNFTLPGRAPVPIFSKDPAVKSFPDKPPPAEATPDMFGKGGSRQAAAAGTGQILQSVQDASALDIARTADRPSPFSMNPAGGPTAQVQAPGVAPTPPEGRGGLTAPPEAQEPWVAKAMAWSPSTTGRIRLAGTPRNQEELLQSIRTAAASNRTFLDALTKFDASKYENRLNIGAVRDMADVVVGLSGSGGSRSNRNWQWIDVGDTGRLPSIMDPNFNTIPVNGFNREALVVHELTEAMVQAGLNSNDPENEAQAWKLYAAAHMTALDAERAFNAYLGTSSQRSAEDMHPAGRSESTFADHSGGTNWPNGVPRTATFAYTDGFVRLHFNRRGRLESVERLPRQ